MRIKLVFEKEETEVMYNSYLSVADNDEYKNVMTKEEFFNYFENKVPCGESVAAYEDDTYDITIDFKKIFIIQLIEQMTFVYLKFKACVDAVLPSTKAFCEKWFPAIKDNSENNAE